MEKWDPILHKMFNRKNKLTTNCRFNHNIHRANFPEFLYKLYYRVIRNLIFHRQTLKKLILFPIYNFHVTIYNLQFTISIPNLRFLEKSQPMFLIGWLFCITFNENFWFCKKCFLTFSELNQRGGLSTSDTQKSKNIPKVYGIKFSKKGQKRHVCDSCVFSIFSSISCGWTGSANLLLS